MNVKSLKSDEVTGTPSQFWVNLSVTFTGAGYTQQSNSSLQDEKEIMINKNQINFFNFYFIFIINASENPLFSEISPLTLVLSPIAIIDWLLS